MNNKRSRYWEIMLYPDSLPDNWKEIITSWYLQACLSPLHDKDKWEETTQDHQKGDYKKSHYHLMLCFGNTTTYKNVLAYAEELNTKQIRAISSSRGAYDYWTHKNNPEKAQYEEKEMLYFGGFTKENCIAYTESEIEAIKRSIISIINNQKITEYATIYDYLNKNEMYECCAVLSHNTIFYNAYIKSKKYSIDECFKVK